MAKLTKDESVELLKVFVRAQNSLKGCALDLARVAFPETSDDRQFKQFEKTIKDKESAIRNVFREALVEAGIIEFVDNKELFTMK